MASNRLTPVFLHWGHFLTTLKFYKMKTIYPTHPMRDYNEWITAVHNYFRMTAAEYVRNKYIRQFTPFRIEPDGNAYYIVDDEKIPAKEFERKFPLPLFVNKNDENPNSMGAMFAETV